MKTKSILNSSVILFVSNSSLVIAKAHKVIFSYSYHAVISNLCNIQFNNTFSTGPLCPKQPQLLRRIYFQLVVLSMSVNTFKLKGAL